MQRPQENIRRRLLKREHARKLRSEMTEAERRLWALLRRKQLAGLRFRRQETIGPYIVDFCCSAAKLVVELDGDQHGSNDNILYDTARTRWLSESGYRVLRFPNGDVMREPQRVLDNVWRAIVESSCPLPEALRPPTLKGRVEND